MRNINATAENVVGLNSAGTLDDVTVVYDNAANISLPGMTIDGNLFVKNGTGTITQSGAIIVDNSTSSGKGVTTLWTPSNQDITLNNAANDFHQLKVESGGNVTLVDVDEIDLYGNYNTLGYHDFRVYGDLTLSAGGNITDTIDYGNSELIVNGLAQFTARSGTPGSYTQHDIVLNNNDNYWNQLQFVAADDVTIFADSNIQLQTSTIDSTFYMDSQNWRNLSQASGSVITTGGNTSFLDYASQTLDQPNNVLGPLSIRANGTVTLRENDAITQFAAWSNTNSTFRLTTSNDQAITLNQNNGLGNVRITQINNGALPGEVGDVLLRESHQIDQNEAWITHGNTYLDSNGSNIVMDNPGNVLGPLKVEGNTTYIYENDTIEDYSNWTTGVTILHGYAGGVLGNGDVILDSASNVLGDLTVRANNVAITENSHITDYTEWTALGDITLNPGASGSYQIIFDDIDNRLGPIDIDGTPSAVTLYENDTITQAGAWAIGTAPITLNSRSYAIDLSESGNVLGNINLLVSNGTPASVYISEDDAITQGSTEWVLPGKSVTLATENEQAITLNDLDNFFGDLTLTGGAVSIRENDHITDGSAWTTGTTTLHPGTSGTTSISLNNTDNVLGGINLNGSPFSVTIVENDDITQASAWVHSSVPIALTASDNHDIILNQTSNALGDLSLTAGGIFGDVTVVDTTAITDGSAWTVGGTASLTAKSGITPLDIILDGVGPVATIGTLHIVEANDVGVQADVNFLNVTDATNMNLTDLNGVEITGATVDNLFKISAGGHITQSGAISATDLLLIGTGGFATLENVGNDVDNLAAGFTGGNLSYTDANSFGVSTVDGTVGIGINANDVSLRSILGTVSSVSNISSISSSLTINTGTGLTLPNMIIAGPQSYTAGGTGITLTSGIQNTAAGNIEFHGNVIVAADLTVQSIDSPIIFDGQVDGSSNILTVNAGLGTITFLDAVTGVGGSGDAQPGLNLTAGGTGSTFESTLVTNNGMTATGPLVFRDNVTLGDGNAGSVFSGQVTLGKVGGMDLAGYDTMRFSGGVLLENGDATINSNNSLLTFEGLNTINGPYGLVLNSGVAEISGLDHLGADLTSLDVTADEIIVPVGGITIAGPQAFTATGGTDITLQGNVASTAAGTITFNSPVTIDAPVGVTSTNSGITFVSTVDGNKDFSVNSGTASTQFLGDVGAITDLGDGIGAALTLGGSGATVFSGGLLANSGITATGPVTFATNVILGNGDTGSTFTGLVTGGGITLSGYDNLNFNGGLTLTGAMEIHSNGSTTDFGGAVGGAFGLSVNAFSGGSGTVTGLNNIGSELSSLTLVGQTLSLPNGLAVSGPMNFTAAGGITLNGNLGSSAAPATGQINFFSPVTLAANGTVRTGDADILLHDTLDGAFNLTLDAGTGIVSLDGLIGGTTALDYLNVVGATELAGGAVTTSDFQSYGNTTLQANTILTGTSVDFTGTLNGAYDLVVNSSNNTRFQGEVGGTTALTSITTDAPGNTVFDTASITTSGTQDYSDAVTLSPDVQITSNGVAFRSTIDGSQHLTVDAGTGVARFEDAVGGATALTEFDVTGTSIQLAGNITTDAGVDTIADPGDITLAGPTTIEADLAISTGLAEGGNITFDGATSTLNGAHSLILAAGLGDVTFDGLVGGVTPLTAIDVSGNNLFLPRIVTNPLSAQTYDALNNITLLESRTLNAPIAFTADSDNSGTGSLILLDGVTVVATNNHVDIVAADLDMQGGSTISSGSGVITITASADGGIGLGDAISQFSISGDELSRMSSSGGINLETTGAGNIAVDNVSETNSQNISGLTTLDAQGTGDVVIGGLTSTFNALTLNAATGAIQVGADLNTTNDNITFQSATTVSGASTINSGGGNIDFQGVLQVDNPLTLTTGNGVLALGDAVTSTSTLLMNLGGGSVTGLEQLQSSLTGLTINSSSDISLPAISVDGPMVFNTGLITVNGNLSGTGLAMGNVTQIGANGLELSSGTGTLAFSNLLGVSANDLTVSGDEINFGGAATGTGNLVVRTSSASQDLALGGSATTVALDLGDSDLANLLSNWNSLTLGRNSGTGTLDFAADVNLSALDLILNGGGGISQSGGSLTSTGDLALWSDTGAIVLDDAGNSLGVIGISGTPTAVSITDTTDITQSAAWSIGTAGVTLDAGTNDIILTENGNSFGTLALTAGTATVNEDAATDFGVSTVDELSAVSTAAITTSGTVTVSGTASLETRNNTGAAITMSNGSIFGNIHAVAGTADGSALADGDITLYFGGPSVLGELGTLGDLTFGGPFGSLFTQTATSSITADRLDLIGAGSDHQLILGTNQINTLAGSANNIEFVENDGFTIGQVGSIGLSAPGLISLSSEGTINQTERVTAPNLLLNGTGGSFILDHANNAVSILAANTGSLSFTENSGFEIGSVNGIDGITLTGDLNLSSTGTVIQTYSITSNALELLGIAGNYDLDTANNIISTIAGNTGNVDFRNDNGFVIGTVNTVGLTTTGNTVLTSSGMVTQNQALSADGLALIGAGANYTLNQAGNSVATVAADTGDVALTTNSAINIGTVNPSGVITTGDFSLTADGEITQTEAMNIGGDLSLTTTHAAGDVAITHLIPAVTTLGNTSIGGDYTVTATGKFVEQELGTTVQVAGDLTIDSASLSLNGVGNLVGGTTTTPSVAELRQAGVITLGNITEAGDYTVVSEASTKTFDGLSVHGVAVTLNNVDNQVAGSISITTSGPTVSDGFEVQTGINQTAGSSLDITGTATFIAEDSSVPGSGIIDLTNTGNSFGSLVLSGTTASVLEDTGNTELESVDVDSLDLTSTGAVTQTGAIVADDFIVNSGASVLLGNVDNNLIRISGNAVDAFTFVDTDDLAVSSLGGYTGVSTTNGAISLSAGDSLDINSGVVIESTNSNVSLSGANVALDTNSQVLAGGSVGITGTDADNGVNGADILFNDGVQVIAASNVTLTGDSMDLHNGVGVAPVVNGTGVLTIQSRDDGDSNPSFSSALDTEDVNFGSAFTSAQFGRSGNLADVTLGLSGLTVDGPVTISGGEVTLGGDLESTALAAAISLNAADNLTLANVTSNQGAVDLNAVAGNISQTGVLTNVDTLTAAAGGSILLDGVNGVDTLGAISAGSGIEIYDDTAGLTIDGDLLTASGNIQVHTEGGALTLADTRTITVSGTGDVFLAAGAGFNFLNQSSSLTAPVVIGDGRYLIYSHDHTTDLGNLTASPYMGRTWAANAPGTVGGIDNRTLFATQATLTFTADDLTRFFGDANPALTYSVDGYTNGDNASTAFSGDPELNTAAQISDNIGFYDISIAQGGTLASDKGYMFDFADGSLEILQAILTVNANDLNKIYGDIDPALTFALSGLKLGHTSGDVLSGGLVRVAGETVADGPYAINQGTLALTNGNYSLDFTGDVFTIDARVIDLSGSRIYNGSNLVDSDILSLSNLVGTETLTLSGAGAMGDKHVGDDKAVAVNTLALGDGMNGGTASNYTLTGGNHLADISQLAIAITADDQTKTYGNADPSLTYAADTSLVGSDSFTGGLERVVGENVAASPYAINQGSLAISDGNGGSNYDLSYLGDALTITARDISLEADVISKTYGNVDPTLGVSISSGSLGSIAVSDSLTDVTGTLTRELGENVGSYDVLLGSGAKAPNYTITYTNDNNALTINQRVVSLEGDRVYNGLATLDASVFTLNNLVGSETLVLGGTGSMADKNVGNNKLVTLDTLSLADGSNGGLASNYSLVGGTYLTDISQLAITLNADAQSKDYGDPDPSWTFQTSTPLVGSDSYSGTLVRAAGENVVDGPFAISQGSLAIVDDNGGANYDLTYVGENLTINARPIDLSGTRVYDGTTVLSNGIFTLENLVGAETLVLGGSGSMANKHVGDDKAVSLGTFALGNGANNGVATNYTLVGGNHAVDITPASLSVAGIVAVDKVYDGTLDATIETSGSVLVGVISSDDVSVGSISGEFDDKNVGNAKTVNTAGFVLTGSDGSNYTLIQPAGLTADITPRALNVTATGEDKLYDGTTDATVVLDDDRIAGDDLSFTYTANFADGNVGTGKFIAVTGISVAGGDSGNYTANTTAAAFADITPATFALIIEALDKIYDGTTEATVQLIGGIVDGDEVLFAYNSAQFDDKNVGTDKSVSVNGVMLTGSDASNYVYDSNMTTTGAITLATLVVSGITANDKVYDATTGATVVVETADLSGLVEGDEVLVAATGSFADKHVGDDKTVSLNSNYTGTDAGNYTITGQTTATADITPAELLISGITASDKVYDSTTSATIDDSGAVYTGLFTGDMVVVDATGAFANKNAGDDKDVVLDSSYAGVDAGNYTITDQDVAVATITPAALTVSGLTAEDKVYDGTTAANIDESGAVYTGLFAGDVLSLDTSGNFSDKNVADDKVVTLDSSYTGADAGNYQITAQATATADITPASLLVSGITANDKVYDATTGATVVVETADLSGLVEGDEVMVAATGSFADKHVGDDKTVSLNSNYTGSDAGNYTITGQTTATADITPAELLISGITASDKVYDSTTGATIDDSGAVYTGLFTGDMVVVDATGAFANKNAGDDKDVVLDSSYAGVDAGNYTITDQDVAVATITPAALTVSGLTADDKVYDGTTVASINDSGAVYTGLFTGDVLSVDANGNFSDKNVADDKVVTLDSSYTGTDAGNYQITDQATATADITPAMLLVSGITANDKVYDATTGATVVVETADLGGLVEGDEVMVAATGSFADKHVGDDKTVSLNSNYTGSDAGNYTITGQTTTTADITPAELLISGITASDKVYDSTTGATIDDSGAVYTGLFTGDMVVVDATGAFANKNAGDDKDVVLDSSYAGIDVGNYTITDQEVATADISRANLLVDGITAQHKVYNGNTVATLNDNDATYTGLFAGDSVALDANGAFDNKNVGSDKTVTISSVMLTGADAGNYAITGQTTAIADITPAALVVSGITANDKIYDATTDATVVVGGATLAGLVAGDQLSVSATGSFEDSNFGFNKHVFLSSSYIGADLTNYTITDQEQTTASITQIPSLSPLIVRSIEDEVTVINNTDIRSDSKVVNAFGGSNIIGILPDSVGLPTDKEIMLEASTEENRQGFTQVSNPATMDLFVEKTFKITLPTDTFEHSDPETEIILRVRLINGQALPTWLRFNPATWTLSGKAPSGQPDLEVVVFARDNYGNEVSTTFRMVFEEPRMIELSSFSRTE